jgi:hypothetical protein
MGAGWDHSSTYSVTLRIDDYGTSHHNKKVRRSKSDGNIDNYRHIIYLCIHTVSSYQAVIVILGTAS